MDGIADVGSSEKYAREDHVHPSDTSKMSTSHPANAITSAKITEWDGKQDADFVVAATSRYDQNDEFTGYTVNKTYAQIYGAFDDGKRVILVLDGWLIYHLISADEDAVAFCKEVSGSTNAIEFICIYNNNDVETAYRQLQPLLVSGTNIKTINNQSLLGSGNLTANDIGAATVSDVNTAISNLVDSAPTTLNTLNELATALGNDPNFATTITNKIAA
jgi:hypothetical protein